MNKKTLPTQEQLHQLFDYSPSTGEVRTIKTGRVIGSNATPRDYFYAQIDGSGYLLQRIIWKWMTGLEPDVIDHINHDKLDNRWINLRDVSWSENLLNRTKPTTGVYPHKQSGLFQAMLKRDGQLHYIGIYGTQDEASNAVRLFKVKRGEVVR